MNIDGCDVQVEMVQVEDTPVVMIVQWGEEPMLSLFMTPGEAMSLGGLLIGMASAGGVPLGDYPDPSAPCDNPGCTQCHGGV